MWVRTRQKVRRLHAPTRSTPLLAGGYKLDTTKIPVIVVPPIETLRNSPVRTALLCRMLTRSAHDSSNRTSSTTRCESGGSRPNLTLPLAQTSCACATSLGTKM